MPLTGEEKKAFQKEYMREYMRKKRLEKAGLNEVLTENQQSSLDLPAFQVGRRGFESRLPLHQSQKMTCLSRIFHSYATANND